VRSCTKVGEGRSAMHIQYIAREHLKKDTRIVVLLAGGEGRPQAVRA
jgi:hypothetical protein